MVCSFVQDSSPRSHVCVVEEASRIGCSYLKRSIAPEQRPMSKHYEHITINCCVRVPASYPSTIFNGTGTIGLYFPNFKYLRGTRFNHRTKISHAIQKCNRSLNCAWSMNVYQK